MTLHDDITALTDRERAALFRGFGYVKKREPAAKRSALGAPPKLSDRERRRVSESWEGAVKDAESRRGDPVAIAEAKAEVKRAALSILRSRRMSA